jgi:hypothetical protein
VAANNTACDAATSGEGYWTCDLGGCKPCRALARGADDWEQLAEWDLTPLPSGEGN